MALLEAVDRRPDQRVCLAAELPDGLIGAITVSVLTQDRLDDTMAAQYATALDACPDS